MEKIFTAVATCVKGNRGESDGKQSNKRGRAGDPRKGSAGSRSPVQQWQVRPIP